MNMLIDLEVRRIAAHEIFLRDEELSAVAPRFSEELASLDPEGIAAIRTRLSKALGSHSKSIEMSVRDCSPGSGFHLCSSLYDADDDTFLDLSQRLAQRLANNQTARNLPGGVVVVLDGTVGAERYPWTAVIKAEVSSGFAKEVTEAGLLLRYLTDLLLTPQQRLHKIGFFVRHGNDSGGDEHFPEDYTVYVFDSLMSGSEVTTAANYFYEGFLGCTAAPSARKMTRDFYNCTRQFIAQAPIDDEKKVEYATALNVYLRSERSTISGVDFATEYLSKDLHQAFAHTLADVKFPDRAVTKDISSIKSKLRVRQLRFSSDVRIVGPAEAFNDVVRMEGEENGATVVRIHGHVTEQS